MDEDARECPFPIKFRSNFKHLHAIKVAVVWLLDTVHQALITHSVYIYLVTHYADPDELKIVVPTLMVRLHILLVPLAFSPVLSVLRLKSHSV